MKNWANLTLDDRRAVLESIRDASADLLPLLWQAYDGTPDARWRKRVGAVLERLRACDLDLNEVPAALYFLPWHVEALERFAAVESRRGDKARRERARVLLQLVSLGDGLALGDWENLLEVEAVKERAAADVAAAQADAAAARGDLANERTHRAEAQARAANAEALAAELRQSRDGLRNQLEDRNRRSRDAKKKARNLPGPCGMPRSLWDRFRVTLGKALAEDKAKPPRERLGQLGVVEFAVKRHNDNATHKIHATTDKDFATILKGWQRSRKRQKKPR